MPHSRPLPPGTSHILNEKGRAFLPPFVGARLKYLAMMFDWWPEEEDVEEEEDQELFNYHEVRGKLSDGHYTLSSGSYVSPIHIWIASEDNCHRSLYVGGSSCWICPDSHDLYFDGIDPTLFSEPPDPNIW